MSAMRVSIAVSRILMGLPLFVFGVNAFVGFMPMPNTIPPEEGGFSLPAYTVLDHLWDTGFVMHSVCLTHALVGTALLTNRFVPLALAIHFPITLQMVLFHVVLDPGTGIMAYVIFALNVFLMFAYREAYASLLAARHKW